MSPRIQTSVGTSWPAPIGASAEVDFRGDRPVIPLAHLATMCAAGAATWAALIAGLLAIV